MSLNGKDKDKNEANKGFPAVKQLQAGKPKNWLASAGLFLLLVIITVSFVIVPSIAPSFGGGAIEFGRYGAQSVVYSRNSYFARRIGQLSQNVSGMGGMNEFMRRYIWEAAFNDAMKRAAWLEEAKKAGVRASDAQVARYLRQSSNLINEGSFDETAFRALDKVTQKAYINQIREELVLSWYLSARFFEQRRAESALAALARPSAQERRFEAAVFSFSAYPAEEAGRFAKENAYLFRRSRLKRLVSQGKEKQALALYKAWEAKESSFEELAKENSQNSAGFADVYAANGGDMGSQFFYQIRQQLQTDADAESVFALKAGQASKPLKMAGNETAYVIYYCDEAEAPLSMDEAGALASVRAYLSGNRKSLMADYFSQRIQNLPGGSGFAAAARAAGAQTFETAFLGLVYNYQASPYSGSSSYFPFAKEAEAFKDALASGPSGFAAAALQSEPFFASAFSLKEGQTPQAIVMDDCVAALRLTAVRPSASLDSSQEPYISYYLDQERMVQIEDGFTASPRYKSGFEKMYAKAFPPAPPVEEEVSPEEEQEALDSFMQNGAMPGFADGQPAGGEAD